MSAAAVPPRLESLGAGPDGRWPRCEQLVDIPPHQVRWVAPPVGSEHAAELLRQALVADTVLAAVDTARDLGRLTVASARLAMHTAQRAGRRRPPWLR